MLLIDIDCRGADMARFIFPIPWTPKYPQDFSSMFPRVIFYSFFKILLGPFPYAALNSRHAKTYLFSKPRKLSTTSFAFEIKNSIFLWLFIDILCHLEA